MYKILSIGEILWDLLPDGKKVGGAPGNFAFHCRQLGNDARMLSRVGDDPLGRELLEYCRKIGLSTELMGIDAAAPTGTVDVQLGSDGQPKYTINENVAWDRLEVSPAAKQWAAQADAVCFGSLAARSEQNRNTIRELIDAVRPEAIRVLDLNLRDPFCEPSVLRFVLSCANILKLNDEELIRVARMFEFSGKTLEEQLPEVIQKYGLRLLIVTCGEQGSYLATESETVYTPSRKVSVVDTVGAGDAFTAATVTGFLQRKPLSQIAELATELAAYVCTQPGGTPQHSEHHS